MFKLTVDNEIFAKDTENLEFESPDWAMEFVNKIYETAKKDIGTKYYAISSNSWVNFENNYYRSFTFYENNNGHTEHKINVKIEKF
jgi:hypothetical protein